MLTFAEACGDARTRLNTFPAKGASSGGAFMTVKGIIKSHFFSGLRKNSIINVAYLSKNNSCTYLLSLAGTRVNERVHALTDLRRAKDASQR